MSEITSAGGTNKRKLALVLALTSLFMIAEVITGLATNSLALLADAGHMLTDAGSIALALLAISFADRPANPQKTYGYYRFEILAALANGLVLLFISFYIFYEAFQRFWTPPEVNSLPMLAVAGVGLVINIISMKLLHHGAKESLNVKGAYLEVLSDVLGSIGVIAGGVIMLTTGWYLVDPIISAGIGLFILPRTWKLLKEVVHILLEGTPAHIDTNQVRQAMLEIEGVQSVHDLHIWTITSGMETISVHLNVLDLTQTDRILRQIRARLKERFQIEHATIQVESQSCEEDGNIPHSF